MAPASRAVGLIAAAFGLSILAGGMDVLAWMPLPVVAGLLISSGMGFLLDWAAGGLRRFGLVDRALVLAVLGATIGFGFLAGVGVGILAAVVLMTINLSMVEVVRLKATGAELRSAVERPASERERLQAQPQAIQVMRLQGHVFFGTARQLLNGVRRLIAETPDMRFLLLDGKRLAGFDSSAAYAFARLAQLAGDRGITLVLAGFSTAALAQLDRAGTGIQTGTASTVLRRFGDLDHALEWCEDTLLTALPPSPIDPGDGDGFRSLAPFLAFADAFDIAEGAVLVGQGEISDDIYFIENGLLTVRLAIPDGPPIRLRTLRSGTVVGEVAFYLGVRRSASVVAERRSLGHRLSRAGVERMTREDPALAARLHALLARSLAERVLETNLLLETATR
jgi:SulP family sulfate permease